MDIQIKRGFIEACVLASTKAGETYGYEIIKKVSPYMEISESTLYPILKRLESSGSVSSRTAEHNGRMRRYFCITQSGLEKLGDFMQDREGIEKIFDYVKGELEND